MAGKSRFVCALEAVERFGPSVSQEQLAKAYQEGGVLPMEMRRNLERGVALQSAAFDVSEKSAADVMDSALLWAYLCPGKPERAMEYAAMDASIDHGADSVEIAKYVAAVMALGFENKDAASCLYAAAELVPEEGKTAHLILDARNLAAQSPASAMQRMDWRYGSGKENCASRLARLAAALILGEKSEDALYGAFCEILDTSVEENENYLRVCAAREVKREEEKPEKCITAALMGPPYLSPGKARQCMLHIENSSSRPMFGPVRSRAEGSLEIMTASYTTVMPGQSAQIPFTAWLPEDSKTIAERNVLYVQFGGASVRFGIAGAQGYRVRARRDGGEWSAWEAFFSKGNRINLDELFGWQGPCAFELTRTLVIHEKMEAELRIVHTCALLVELDGQEIMQGQATDGWTQDCIRQNVCLEKGEHVLRIRLERRMPGGICQVDFISGGELLSMEAVNPLKGR